MSKNTNSYDIDPHIAEFYDSWETETDDVDLIRQLINGMGKLRMVEPFCGTGRVLVPLAQDGHELIGLDQSQAMLDRARDKLAELSDGRANAKLILSDATEGDWPGEANLVLLGGNCFYELADAEEQEACVASAAAALKTGGYVYVDNDHMEDEVSPAWLRPGRRTTVFPMGQCADGTRLTGTTELLSVDFEKRMWRALRGIVLEFPDGTSTAMERIQHKHPVRYSEVEGWLNKHGFRIEQTFGDRKGSPYKDDAPRAIFWARKMAGNGVSLNTSEGKGGRV